MIHKNKILQITMIMLALIGLSINGFAQVNLDEGRIAYYPFNGNANDESGNDNNGTINGATLTPDRFGNMNNAFSFNGLTDNISFTTIPMQNIDNWCISTWAQPNSLNTVQTILLLGKDDGIGNPTLNGYSVGIGFTGFLSSFTSIFSDVAPINSGYNFSTINQWTHLVVQRDNGITSFYVNGEKTANTSTEIPRIPSDFIVGSSTGIRYFDGNIDDISIYNRVLSETEILTLYTGFSISTINISNTKVGRIIEIPITTTELQIDDNIISYQFDYAFDNTKLEYIGYTLDNCITDGGSITINDATTGQLTVGYMTDNALSGAGDLIKLQLKVIDSGTSDLTISNFVFNDIEVTNITNGSVSAEYFYGDVNANDNINAYDAALTLQYSVGIDPLPEIDPLPWELWRITTANVDGINDVTAIDAGLILQYSVGLITEFPVESGTKSGQKESDIIVEIVDNEFIFTTQDELLGFNLYVTNNSNVILGEPEFLDPNMLSATQIEGETYNVGMCIAISPASGTQILKIPFTGELTGELIFNMKVNNTDKSVTFGTTGILEINTKGISIYPNPATDKIQILSSVSLDNSTIEIYTISGKLVNNISANDNNEINISNLSKGIYIIKINSETVNFVQKIIKE